MKKLLLLTLALLLAAGAAAEGVEFAEQYGVRWFQEGGLFGLERADGTEILPARFSAAEPFVQSWVEGRALARVKRNLNTLLIDPEGNAAIESKGGILFSFGSAICVRNDKESRRFLDARTGKDLGIAAERASVLSEDRLALYNGKHCIIVDRDWNTVFEVKCDEISAFKDGAACVRVDYRLGLVREDGTWISEPQWVGMETLEFFDGYALVYKDERYRFLDKNGERAFGRDWPLATEFRNGVAFVYEGAFLDDGSGISAIEEKWQMIDTEGGVILKDLPRAYEFSGGLARFEQTGLGGTRFGYIDVEGNVAIEPAWREAEHFSQDGLAAVLDPKTLLWGYIDRSGSLAVPCRYDRAEHFCHGLAAVKRGERWGFVDRTGAEVIPPIWQHATCFTAEGFALVTLDDANFSIDTSGKAVGSSYPGDPWSWW